MRFINLLLLSLLVVISGCNNNPLKVDVSDIDLEMPVQRFDRELFSLKRGVGDLDSLKKKYNDYFLLYSTQVIKVGNPEDSLFPQYLNEFLSDSLMNLVYQKCQDVFPDMVLYEELIVEAFKHYKYYFPEGNIPKLYTHISGFNQSIMVARDLISVSLDRYLRADSEFYAQLGIPLYARYKMTPERIPIDVVLAFGLTEFPYNPLKDNVLSNMIYQGKIRYFVQAMMPEISEATIMGYNPEQMEWCILSQENMWSFLIEQRHLFSSEYRVIMNYINEGPFTPGMPKESPSRTGIWLGLQIVKEYMRSSPGVDLSALMSDQDYEKILRESGYQPD